jgi:hypothetical protein
MNQSQPTTPQTGQTIPITPRADPLEDNPNNWNLHTAALPVFRLKRPIQVEYEDHSRKVISSPHLIDHEEAKKIRFWRWHKELEKMPFWLPFVYHRRFTFWDRVRILFGRNIVIPMQIACRHSPGEFQPVAICYVTKSTGVEAFMQNEIKLASARYLKEGAQEVK